MEDSLGKLFLNFVYPEDRTLNQQLFTPLVQRKKEHCRHTIRYLTKDVEFRWIEVFARLTLDENDNIIGTSGTLTDVHERILMEQELKISRDHLTGVYGHYVPKAVAQEILSSKEERVLDISVIPILRNLSKEHVFKLEDKAIQRTYPKNSFLFKEGQLTDSVYLIISGHIKTVMLYKNGREKTLTILKTGDFFGEMTFFQDELRTVAAVALAQSTVIAIKKSDFQILLNDIPQLSIELISILSGKLADTYRQVHDLTFLDARSKVISTLIQMSKTYGRKQKDATEISLKLTHEELSNIVGITRENVTKTLNELQDLKIIEVIQKQIRILNLNKLNTEIL